MSTGIDPTNKQTQGENISRTCYVGLVGVEVLGSQEVQIRLEVRRKLLRPRKAWIHILMPAVETERKLLLLALWM